MIETNIICKKSSASSSDLRGICIEAIKKDVGGKNPTLLVEKEFIRRITQIEECVQTKEACEYFLDDFSTPILLYISKKVFQHPHWKEIWGEYYEFISKENQETKIPYYKLTFYGKFENTTLCKYVATITTRHFVDEKMRDVRSNDKTISIDGSSTYLKDKSGNTVIENPWFNLLINNEERNIEPSTYQKIDYVLSKLPERETRIIKYMVMDNMSGLEAFEELEPYMEEKSKTPTSTWTTKQKQDAMALLKSRALKHINTIIKNEKINF